MASPATGSRLRTSENPRPARFTVLHARTATSTATVNTCFLDIAPFPRTRRVCKALPAAALKRLPEGWTPAWPKGHPPLNVIKGLRNNAAEAKDTAGHTHYDITANREGKSWLSEHF
ncbi:hypothetical protein [Streptomyces scopuliridis]|uniref:hypothetical protein n=1 Tax=Streptomyces scopuliridis TaxID=452529 RepID=UPI003681B545